MPEDLLTIEAENDQQDDIQDLDQQQDDQQRDDKQGQEGDKAPITSLFQADGKKLDPQVSAKIAEIKKDNPSLGKLLNEAVHKHAALEREFPGGLTEIKELRDKVEELGGFDTISQKLESLQEMDGLAQAYMDSDPAFVEDLVASSPEAFAALAPVVFQKFAEVNPEGFSAYLGRVVLNDMQANGLPLLLERMQDLIPADNAKLQEIFNRLNGYLDGFKALAEKPMPAAKAAKAAPGGKATDDLSKREEAVRIKEWQIERDTIQKGIVNQAFTKTLAGRKPDSEEKAQILELFLSRSKSAADKLFPGWNEKAQRYISSNDKKGYIRYMQSIYTRVVPEAMQSAVQSTLKGKKAAATDVKKPAGAKPPAAASGFKPVANEPPTWDVDYSRTSRAMLQDNKAILKDGTKVVWR